jgi:hypothetical protein
MQEMGFAICCLLCDAADEAGSARCRVCIAAHEKARERIGRDRGGPIEQLARDLIAFSTEPQRHDHDGEHGPLLQRYTHLLAAHAGQRAPPTQVEIEAIFDAARRRTNKNVLRDAANENPWTEKPPDAVNARTMVESLPLNLERHDGARTVPSKPIEQVDRSDRIGEDAAVGERISVRAEVESVPERLREPLEEMLIEEKVGKRQQFQELLDDLGDLLDE